MTPASAPNLRSLAIAVLAVVAFVAFGTSRGQAAQMAGWI